VTLRHIGTVLATELQARRGVALNLEVIRPHAERASTVEDSYRDAAAYAKKHAPEGDIKAKGLNGKFHHIQKGK
jgi:hypothetical protein